MVGLNQAAKTRSGPIVTFRPAASKRWQPKRLQSRRRLDEPYLIMARYYSTSLGRFMAVDPSSVSIVLTSPQSWNRYTYAANNPLRYVDPDGTHNEEGHTTLTNEALGGGCECSTEATGKVTEANLGQDTFWTSIADTSAEGANQHGMAGKNEDGTWQSSAAAQAETTAYIDGQVAEAASLALNGDAAGV